MPWWVWVLMVWVIFSAPVGLIAGLIIRQMEGRDD